MKIQAKEIKRLQFEVEKTYEYLRSRQGSLPQVRAKRIKNAWCAFTKQFGVSL